MNRQEMAMRLVGMGFYIVICLIIGVAGGLWLDTRFGTRPIFVLAGILMGLALSGYGVYQMLAPILKSDKSGDDS